MKTFEMVSPAARPIDDQEGHIPFEPFTRVEWIVTLLLVLVCFGIPLGMVIHYHREMARLEAAALAETKGGSPCAPSYRGSSVPAGGPGSAGRSTTSNAAISGGQGDE